MGNSLDRRLFGGSQADYARLESSRASDYDLPHEAPDLERQLPRSALGRPLETWSLGVGSTRQFYGRSTWFRSTSDRTVQDELLGVLGLPWGALSVAATCRVDGLDPLATVQARRFAGASQDRLRAAINPSGALVREIDGVPVWETTIRVNPVPPLQTETVGWQLVRGDTVFEIHGPGEAWSLDVVDQVIHGPRPVPPSFSVRLPEGWVGAGIGDDELGRLASRLESMQPGFAEALRTFPSSTCPPSSTFVAVDLEPAHLARFPTRLIAVEYLTWRNEGDERLEGMHRHAAERTGAPPAIVRRRTESGSLAAFEMSDPGAPDELIRMAVHKGGPRTLHVALTTRRADAGRDVPLFDAILDSIAFDEAAIPGRPVDDPAPLADEPLDRYLRRVRLLPGEGCAVIEPGTRSMAQVQWRYAGAGSWDWWVTEGPGTDGPRHGGWRLDSTTDTVTLATEIAATVGEVLGLGQDDASALTREQFDVREEVERRPGEPEGAYLGRAIARSRDELGVVVVGTGDPMHRWPEEFVFADADSVTINPTLGAYEERPRLAWTVRKEADLEPVGTMLATALRDRSTIPEDVPLVAWWRPAAGADEGLPPTGWLDPDPAVAIEQLIRGPKGFSGEESMVPARHRGAGLRATVRRSIAGGGFTVHWIAPGGADHDLVAGRGASDPEATIAEVVSACRRALGVDEGGDLVVGAWLQLERASPVFPIPAADEGSPSAMAMAGEVAGSLLVYATIALLVAGVWLIPALVSLVVLLAVAAIFNLAPVLAVIGAAAAALVVPPLAARIERRFPATAQGSWPGRLARLAAIALWVLVASALAIVVDTLLLPR